MADFDKELGVWQTEQEKVMIPAYEVDFTKKIAKQIQVEKTVDVQVMYTRPDVQKFTCDIGQHEWYMTNPKTYTVSCKKCPMHRVLIPARHKLHEGQIFDRASGKFLF